MASALLTAAILIGITFLFILLFSLLHAKGKQKALANRIATFEQLVSTHNLIIHEKEEFQYYSIAIDTSNSKLLYCNFNSTAQNAKVVNLQKIKTVRVDVEENSISENRKGKRVIVEKKIIKLQLALHTKDPNSIEFLPFYQYQDGVANYTDLIKRLEYWRGNIDKIINPRQNKIYQ